MAVHCKIVTTASLSLVVICACKELLVQGEPSTPEIQSWRQLPNDWFHAQICRSVPRGLHVSSSYPSQASASVLGPIITPLSEFEQKIGLQRPWEERCVGPGPGDGMTWLMTFGPSSLSLVRGGGLTANSKQISFLEFTGTMSGITLTLYFVRMMTWHCVIGFANTLFIDIKWHCELFIVRIKTDL